MTATDNSNARIHALSRDEAPAFAPMAFPAFRRLLTDPPDRDLVWIGARDADGAPVGLAAGMGGPDGEFEMFAAYISPLYRRTGLGQTLTDRLCDDFATLGYRRGVHFFTVDADDQGYAKFLMRCGWSRPVVRQLVCRTDLDHAWETPWLRDTAVPDGYRIVAWQDITDAARADLAARHAADPTLWPESLDPFHYETDCDAATSVALLRAGGMDDGVARETIVGWVLTHPLDDETLRWTCSWVIDRLQGAARIVPLWWQVAKRQRATSARDKFIWTVPVEQPRMARFAARRMRPWLLSLGYACMALRDLG